MLPANTIAKDWSSAAELAGMVGSNWHAPESDLERSRGIQLDQLLQSLERGYIEAALRLTRGNVSQAAKMLGVNRTTLYSRMNEPEEKDR